MESQESDFGIQKMKNLIEMKLKFKLLLNFPFTQNYITPKVIKMFKKLFNSYLSKKIDKRLRG